MPAVNVLSLPEEQAESGLCGPARPGSLHSMQHIVTKENVHKRLDCTVNTASKFINCQACHCRHACTYSQGNIRAGVQSLEINPQYSMALRAGSMFCKQAAVALPTNPVLQVALQVPVADVTVPRPQVGFDCAQEPFATVIVGGPLQPARKWLGRSSNSIKNSSSTCWQQEQPNHD